jgi:hypothetical protein
MSERAATALPGSPPPVLDAALRSHSEERRAALVQHILGGTSADWLSDWFKRAGTPVGATTIKTYRSSL